jgi:hypothetical protein
MRVSGPVGEPRKPAVYRIGSHKLQAASGKRQAASGKRQAASGKRQAWGLEPLKAAFKLAANRWKLVACQAFSA